MLVIATKSILSNPWSFSDVGFVGKQPVAWKTEYCEEYCQKKFRESMDRCTGRGDITKITVEKAVKHLINQSLTKPKNNIVAKGENEGLQHGYFSFITMLAKAN